MKSFKVMPHTADVRLRIEASGLAELFAAALEGLDAILKKDFCYRLLDLGVVERIEITSVDTTALLIDFLSEALSLAYIDSAIFCEVRFQRLEAMTLAAELLGAKVDGFDEDIKAVSYHEAEVVRNERGDFQTNLVFDI